MDHLAGPSRVRRAPPAPPSPSGYSGPAGGASPDMLAGPLAGVHLYNGPQPRRREESTTPTVSPPLPPPARPDSRGTHRSGGRRDERARRLNEFDRGPIAAMGARQLYDPTLPPQHRPPPASPVPPVPSVPPAPPVPPVPPQHMLKDERRREPVPASRRKLYDPSAPPPQPPLQQPRSRRPEGDRGRRLYDPDAAGPSNSHSQSHLRYDDGYSNSHSNPNTHLQPRSNGSRSIDPAHPSLSVLRRPSPGMQSAEELADRERERRRRREGSEKSSSVHGGGPHSRRKDSDTRSRGSRSSEGSESFKGRTEGDSGAKALLRTAYNELKALELSLTEMHRKMGADPEAGIRVLLDPGAELHLRPTSDDSLAWAELVSLHKELADCHYNFLKLSLDPKNPPGLRPFPVKYNIPARLWQMGFHAILERLRFAWMSHNPLALDILTDFIYDAYQFYTELFEDQMLAVFRTAWIEALGDLARYRMAVASALIAEAGAAAAAEQPHRGPARIDDDDDGVQPPSSGASIGQEVADNWDVEDKETWRTTARDWYAMGITEKPGEGRLQHHLALLSCDVRGRETRALYHFAKSLIASHPFETSREKVLVLFDAALQHQRSAPEATAMDLFVRLHGMLFTRIELDDFRPVMSRFMERLEEDASLDGVSRKACISLVDWLLMGIVNLAAILQYGSDAGMIRKALAQENASRRRQHTALDAEEAEDGEDAIEDGGGAGGGEDTPLLAQQSAPNTPPPTSFTLALELAFAMLSFTFSHPFRQQGIHQVLNPYLTIVLTFLATLFRQPSVGAPLLPHIPWRRLAAFVNSLGVEVRDESRLIGPAPLPEDWMMRGMEWVTRRVYERGFWKPKAATLRGSSGPAVPRVGERFQSEMDVLLANFDSAVDITEGVVVADDDGADQTDGPVAVNERRRRRIAWAAGVLAAHVDGFSATDGRVAITGSLAAAIDEADAAKAEEERREAARKAAAAHRPSLEELDYAAADIFEDEDGDADGVDPELDVLRERRRYLRDLLKTEAPSPAPALAAAKKSAGTVSRAAARRARTAAAYNVVPGYTTLIFDTNVLLSSLGLFSRVVEGGQWSVVVPLPVVTELDGLSKNPPPLGSEAQAAVAYLEARIRTHALCLKIQTARGNYLTDLLIRAEVLGGDAAAEEERGRTMDDMILNVATFQREHFVDRSALLGMPAPSGKAATQVLLVTFDRNLRLKARARGIDAADEREMAAILGQ